MEVKKIYFLRSFKNNTQGISLIETLIASVILLVSILAIYSAVTYGYLLTKKSEYVATAGSIARYEIEKIKSLGVINANPYYYGDDGLPAVHPRTVYTKDSTYETEVIRVENVYGNPQLKMFIVNVYLYGRPTTNVLYAKPLVTYYTYLTEKGL